jgi:hypothetical protein
MDVMTPYCIEPIDCVGFHHATQEGGNLSFIECYGFRNLSTASLHNLHSWC